MFSKDWSKTKGLHKEMLNSSGYREFNKFIGKMRDDLTPQINNLVDELLENSDEINDEILNAFVILISIFQINDNIHMLESRMVICESPAYCLNDKKGIIEKLLIYSFERDVIDQQCPTNAFDEDGKNIRRRNL